MKTSYADLKPDEWEPPLIAAIGIGTGAGCLSASAIEWIRASQVLAGGTRHLELFPSYGGEKIQIGSPLSECLDAIDRASKTERVAVLCSGDPMFFGIGNKLAEKFGRERLHVIPGITSVQALCARVCETMDDIGTVSFHGREAEAGIRRVLDAMREGRKVAVVTDPAHGPQWVARRLIECGRGGFRLIVGEDLGSPSERVRSLSPEEAAAAEFSSLNVLLVEPDISAAPSGADDGRVFGFGEEAFEHEAGMITKMEVRAVALAALRLGTGQVIWDVGAASGSVSIEAARIARGSRVFAVEKNEARYARLQKNLDRFCALEVKAVCARARDALPTFPDPDRVFIGGGGEDLDAVLRMTAERLRPDGVVVQTAVLLRTLEEVSAFWKKSGFETSITQVQVSRSVPTGSDTRLEALNPVFIIITSRMG